MSSRLKPQSFVAKRSVACKEGNAGGQDTGRGVKKEKFFKIEYVSEYVSK